MRADPGQDVLAQPCGFVRLGQRRVDIAALPARGFVVERRRCLPMAGAAQGRPQRCREATSGPAVGAGQALLRRGVEQPLRGQEAYFSQVAGLYRFDQLRLLAQFGKRARGGEFQCLVGQEDALQPGFASELLLRLVGQVGCPGQL